MRTSSFFFRHGLLPSTALSSTPSLLLAFFVVLAPGFHAHLALWSKSETGSINRGDGFAGYNGGNSRVLREQRPRFCGDEQHAGGGADAGDSRLL